MPATLDKLAAKLLIRSGLLSAIERQDAARPDILRILLYHRVGQPADHDSVLDPSLLSATPDQFAQQMAFLARHCHLVSIGELLDAINSGRPLPPSSVMVTFDDGYNDFLTAAWPVLEQLHIPAVLFVVTQHLSDPTLPFWWDRLYQAVTRTNHACLQTDGVGHYALQTPQQRWLAFTELKAAVKSMEFHQAMAMIEEIARTLGVHPDEEQTNLTWDEVAGLAARGLCIAPHTRTHPVLSRVTEAEARQEIFGCQLDIDRRLGQRWPVFAYPCGHQADICPGLLPLLREGGFEAAMTCIEGHNVLHRTDHLLLRRVSLAPHLSLAEFRLVLTGIYDIYGALHKLRQEGDHDHARSQR